MELNGQPLSIQDSELRVADLPHYSAAPLETQQPPPPYQSPPNLPSTPEKENSQYQNKAVGLQDADFSCSFKGYEDGIRKRLEVDTENQPKITLWVRTSAASFFGNDGRLTMSTRASSSQRLARILKIRLGQYPSMSLYHSYSDIRKIWSMQIYLTLLQNGQTVQGE